VTSVSEEINFKFYLHVMSLSLGSYPWLVSTILNTEDNAITNSEDSRVFVVTFSYSKIILGSK
jgi:hypothetical protein